MTCDAGVCKTFAGDALCAGVTTVDKGCSAPENCAIGWHQLNCCGSMAAIGMNHAALAAFEADEALCVSTMPVCDCPTEQPIAEDGNRVADMALVQVTCTSASVCETYVR